MDRPYSGPAPEAVDRLFADWDDGPGGAVSVLVDGEVVHRGLYGLADVPTRTPFPADQPFAVASVTKSFVAYTVMTLEADGLLHRSDLVRDHLPELADFGTPVTVEHLLRHRSGIRDHITLATLAGGQLLEGLTYDSVRSLVLGHRTLDFPPDSRAEYSNSNYQLLSWLIERVTGQPLGDVLAERIFRPLGMTSTVLAHTPETQPATTITGYEGVPQTGFKVWRSIAYVAGDGGVWSTVEDVERWMRHLATATGAARVAFDEMMRVTPLSDGGSTGYLAGLREDAHLGERIVGHSGGWAGYRSNFAYFPERRLGVVVLGNQTINPVSACVEVADLYLPPPSPDLAGTYRSDELSTDWTITFDGPAVLLSCRGLVGSFADLPVRRSAPETFVMARAALARWELEYHTEFTVTRDADGAVTGLTVRSDNLTDVRFARR